MALLSDSDSEDETNNNENDKQVRKEEEEVETEKFEDQEVQLFPLPEEKPNKIIDGSLLESEPEPMHTLYRPRYNLEEDTRRPYNKWITDVSLGAGWKMKRNGAGIIYKDKKGSIFKSRFRALKHLISRQTLEI